jgi:hypothetical protein
MTHAVRIGLGDTLGDHLGVALFVTGIATVFTLVSFASEEELLT